MVESPTQRDRLLRRIAWSLLVVFAIVMAWFFSKGQADVAPAREPASAASTAAPLSNDSPNSHPTAPAVREAPPQPTATITGIVLDAVDTPLPLASLSAHRADAPGRALVTTTTVDPNGRFVLDVPTDTWLDLVAHAPDHRPERLRIRAPHAGLTIRLTASPRLRGRVVTPEHRGVADAAVHWASAHEPDVVHGRTTTRPDGTFELTALPNAIDLQVHAAGHVPLHRFVPVRWTGPDGGPAPELVLVLDRGRARTGRVLDADTTTGVADAVVSLWHYRGSYTHDGRRCGPAMLAETVRTQADGTFTLTRLPSITGPATLPLWLWVTAPGRAPHGKQLPLAAPDRDDAFPARDDALHVRLYASGAATGRVVDAAGAPVANVRVHAESTRQLLCDAGTNLHFRAQDFAFTTTFHSVAPAASMPFHQQREAITDHDGRYHIDELPCTPEGDAVHFTVAGEPQPGATAPVRAGQVTTVPDLIAPASPLVRWHGRVQTTSGDAVAGAAIEIGACHSTTDERGHFDLLVPAEPEVLELVATAPGRLPYRGPGVLEHDGARTITLTAGHRLRIVLVDRHHEPIADGTVEGFADHALVDFERGSPRPNALRRGRSDGRGLLVLDGVPSPCDVLAEVAHATGKTHRRVLEGVDAAAGTLTIVFDEVDRRATAASLTIRAVEQASGAPFAGLLHVQVVAGQPNAATTSDATTSDTATYRTTARGPEVTITDLPRSAATVFVRAEGFGVQRFDVQRIGDVVLDVVLDRGATVVGLVQTPGPQAPGPLHVTCHDVRTQTFTHTMSDAAGNFRFRGVGAGDYEFFVDPLPRDSTAAPGATIRQSHASPSPVLVHVREGAASPPVVVPVEPIAWISIHLERAHPSPARSTWSWTNGLEVHVRDEQGHVLHRGPPTHFLTTAAEVLLPVRPGLFTVTVYSQGHLIAERHVPAGATCTIEAP
jgi:hypothetical protein